MDNINVDVRLIKQIGSVKVVMLKGEAGSSIESIEKTSIEGLVDTYTITLTDGSHYTFQVTNGSSIASIEKTASVGNTDIYTITLTDGSTSTFEVVNGDNWIDNDEKVATDFLETITGGKLSKCEIELVPVQPLHGYEYPWVGGAGKNKAYLEQGSLDLNDGSEIPSTTRVRTNFISVQGGQSYVASSENNGWSIRNGCTYDASKNFISNGVYPDPTDGTITIPSGVSYVRFIYSHSNTSETCDPDDYWYQFEQGSTATSYAPYSNICPISGHTQVKVDVTHDGNTDEVTQSLGTTVYGGSDEVVGGEVESTEGRVLLSDLTWTMNTSGTYPIFEAVYPMSLIIADASYDGLVSSAFTPVAPMYRSVFAGIDRNGCIGLRRDIRVIQVQDNRYNTADAFSNALTDEDVVFARVTPLTITTSPTQIDVFVGQNNLSCPLDGQSIVENGVTYRYLFTWDDINGITDALADRIDDIEDVLAETSYTSAVSCLVDDTTCTITDSAIKTTSLIEVFSSNTSGDTTVVANIAVTIGQAVLTFDALVEATSFKLRITNL